MEPRGNGTERDEGIQEARRPFARLLDFLGLERNVVVMIAAASIQALGTGLWMAYLSKVLKELGATGKMIGVFGAIGAFMSAVAPYPGGLLSDRLGRGRHLSRAWRASAGRGSLSSRPSPCGGLSVSACAPRWTTPEGGGSRATSW